MELGNQRNRLQTPRRLGQAGDQAGVTHRAFGEEFVQITGIAFFLAELLLHGLDEHAGIGEVLVFAMVIADEMDDFPMRFGQLNLRTLCQRQGDGFVPVRCDGQKPAVGQFQSAAVTSSIGKPSIPCLNSRLMPYPSLLE